MKTLPAVAISACVLLVAVQVVAIIAAIILSFRFTAGTAVPSLARPPVLVTDGENVLVRLDMPPVRNAKQWAKLEAERCAALGYDGYVEAQGHPGGACPFGDVTGTGFSTEPDDVPTCEPYWWQRMTLVGDATAPGADGYYRCRVWKANKSAGWSETRFSVD